jgi:hypothetical protein
MPEINWLSDIAEIPNKAVDPLAEVVMTRFNAAVAWQSIETVGSIPLRQSLENCFNQQHGVLSCVDKQRAEALGVDAVVNLTALKSGVAQAYMADALASGTAELPWVISPTPRPDISPASQQEVLQEIKLVLMQGGVQNGNQLVEMIRFMKKVQQRQEKEKAEAAANEMMLLMADQAAEGGFYRALNDFIQYFPVYPFAVFVGPYITRAPRLIWGQSKPRMATEVFPVFRAISPFDFVYSPDSPDTQRGTAVFTRTLWTRKQLLDAAQLPSYLQKNVLDVLKEADTNVDMNLSWLSRAPDSPKRNLSMWSSNVAPAEVLTHYGLMSGRELQKYGFSGLDDKDFYNSEISMINHRIIQVKIPTDSKLQVRPIYTASFYRTSGDRIAGDSIATRLRDVERAYHASLQYLMRNAHNASAPLCEADYRRLSKNMTDSDLGHVVPGMMYLSESDPSNSNTPALKFFNIPSNLPAYVQLMDYFSSLADRITNLPAALHGEPQGTGAMRTFRGMATLQGNATRALNMAVSNISEGIFVPLGELLYDTNMIYSRDASIKGDSRIVAKGVEGLLKKEMEKQSAMEILQIMGAVGAQLGNMMNIGPVISWSLQKLMGAMGVPPDVLAQMSMPPPGGPATGMPGAGPNPEGGFPEPQGAPMGVGGEYCLIGG